MIHQIFISAATRLLSRHVFIPVMPGTNCEYDSAKAFERAGAKVITKVFRNMSASDIVDSVEVFEKSNRTVTDHHVPRWIQCW